MSCDIVFVCQAGDLEKQAILLAQSIRLFGGKMAASHLHAMIPIPEKVYGVVAKETLTFLESLGVQSYFFPNPISDSHWYSNKLNAFNIDYKTQNIIFLDTDVLVLDDFSEAIEHKGVDILIRPAISSWPPKRFGEALWRELYRDFNLSVPTRRVLSVGRKTVMLPYFNTGVIVCSSHVGFSKFWIEACEKLYRRELPKKYVFLDQISLAIAISLADLSWDTLEENFHFYLSRWVFQQKFGWALKRSRWFTPPRTLADAKIVHYQVHQFLEYAAKYDPTFARKFSRLLTEVPFERTVFAAAGKRSVMRKVSALWNPWKRNKF